MPTNEALKGPKRKPTRPRILRSRRVIKATETNTGTRRTKILQERDKNLKREPFTKF